MKEALKQMLNDVDVGLKNALIRVNELVAENKALKKALAQPEQERLAKVEPCAVCGEGKARLSVLRSCDTCHSEYAGQAEMKVALGKPEQEPVAYQEGMEVATRAANESWTLACKKMVAFEREACAKVCEQSLAAHVLRIAAEIRARGNT